MGQRRKKRAACPGLRLTKLSPNKNDSRSAANVSCDERSTSPSRVNCLSSVAELQPLFAYTEVPDEVLVGVDVDLSVWSVVVHDSCMLRLGGRRHLLQQAAARGSPVKHEQWQVSENQLSDALAATVSNAFGTRPYTSPSNIHRLNLAGAENLTDQGLYMITRVCPNLKYLNLDKAAKLTDVGVRHLVSSCRGLQALYACYVPSLRGLALTAIAELQIPLRELGLAGCPHVPEFALHRVFMVCTSLEHLDLSFCDSVTDATLLALSRSCRKLKHLRIRGCRQTSDAGVVNVANGCPDLLLLDLTRFDLHYKLNDIALLSLAEKCAVLQTINLSGCEMLTDVGASWLASGCSALTHLDLSGCAKITDIGLRALGENLLQLRHLALKNCTRVSNLGIRHVALGCPELSFLDVSGLILLSDSHSHDAMVSAASTLPGHATDFRQGIALLAAQCPRLRHIDLSRCVSIGDGTLRHLATESHELTVLHLAGCARVSSKGVGEVLSSCVKLTALTLTDCSNVDDSAFLVHRSTSTVQEQCRQLSQLTVLRLRHCSNISDVSIRALARAGAPLRELDLSGCGRVSDNGILALAESAMGSTLRYLWLRDLGDVSETALSWLAERCSKLLLLDLTGCSKIHSYSLKSLSSEWKFATYAPVHGFIGMKPVYRAEDRLFVEEYGDCWRAAIRIQCLFRARVARRVARQRREEQLVLWVATRLQSVHRGRQARKVAVLRRLQFNKETAAARRIQTKFRQRLAQESAMRMRLQRQREDMERAARYIQVAWRRKRLRERLLARSLRRMAAEERRERAASKLQKLWRGKMTRSRVSVLRAAKLVRDREHAEAANTMQNMFRARAARREANKKRDERRLQERRQEQAALLLQAHVRRRRAQRDLRRRRRRDQELHDAARCIQRRWRARKKSVAAKIMLIAARRKREYEAAVKLQSAWKRKKGWDEVRLLRLLREKMRQQEIEAALRVQTNWRGKRARAQAAAVKHNAIEKVLLQLRLENRCATLIQAHFRGRRGRVQYRERLLCKKQRWKSITHPDTGQAFYYNKETGEVRFRPPQDVLDLLPKPMCDNCVSPNISIAHVECKDCGEVYCETCWRHVHAGGKRKVHEFRVLYDFYDKRIDYGDSEFPSRWPSEIAQDEMDGWALRTIPYRQPVETKGAWERYVDAASGREWFYNRETEANSYVPPRGVFQPDSGVQPTPRRGQAPVESGQFNWVKYLDEMSGYCYYYNASTMESTYTRPMEFATPRTSRGMHSGRAVAVERSADGWAKYVDPASGYPFYYNAATMESTFARPATFLTPRDDAVPIETGPNDWAKYYDDAQGVYYYYNTRTKISSYDRPVAFATPRVDAATAAASGMQSFVDVTSKRTYYFNAETTECRQGGSSSGGGGNVTGRGDASRAYR